MLKYVAVKFKASAALPETEDSSKCSDIKGMNNAEYKVARDGLKNLGNSFNKRRLNPRHFW